MLYFWKYFIERSFIELVVVVNFYNIGNYIIILYRVRI